jgi:hypothetical protein
MSDSGLQSVADAVVRRAQRQGFVLPRDVRSELKLASLPEEQWKDVLALAKGSLHFRQGRYYFLSGASSPRLQQEQEQQRLIEKAIRGLIRRHRQNRKDQDRRGQVRVDFIQPVQVRTEDGKEFTLLSRDLSTTGIRLLGTRRLLGQKLQLKITGEDPGPWLMTRILWTCAIGDDLFENGGHFLELVNP